MSLSLNSVFGKLMPRPKAVLGVGIGRNRLYAAHAVLGKQGWHVHQIKHISLPFKMFGEALTPEVGAVLATALSDLCAEVKYPLSRSRSPCLIRRSV